MNILEKATNDLGTLGLLPRQEKKMNNMTSVFFFLLDRSDLGLKKDQNEQLHLPPGKVQAHAGHQKVIHEQ